MLLSTRGQNSHLPLEQGQGPNSLAQDLPQVRVGLKLGNGWDNSDMVLLAGDETFHGSNLGHGPSLPFALRPTKTRKIWL